MQSSMYKYLLLYLTFAPFKWELLLIFYVSIIVRKHTTGRMQKKCSDILTCLHGYVFIEGGGK